MLQTTPCSFSGGLCRNCSFLTGGQGSHLQTVTIPEAKSLQLRRRPPEDEQGSTGNM
jgi:hypothetical protein